MLDQYYTRLRTLSKRCDFADADFEIMLQIVLYGTSSRLRKQALRDPKMTLQGLLVTGRQLERNNVQARYIEEDMQELQREDANINLVKAKATLVEIVVKNGLTLRDLAQPKENNVKTAINSTTLLNYVDLQEPTYVKVTHQNKINLEGETTSGQSKQRKINFNRVVSQVSQITAML